MSQSIRREMLLAAPPDEVWPAIADTVALAQWMYPNDFEPRVGHQFTFRVPPKPAVGFDGLEVRCEVLECEPPTRLVFSWSVAGPVVNTRVSFQLEPEGDGTRLLFEHAGFDLAQPFGKQAFEGAGFGWAKMLGELATMVGARTAVVETERVFAATARKVFAAFEQPDQLARWWGPKDFTNTFEQFEFKPGGRWVFVMHSPNGASYANESVFREIEPHSRIVIEHVLSPTFKLTVTLRARGDETHLSWVQEFETAEAAERLRPVVAPANEQNLDRLETLLASNDPDSGQNASQLNR